jgi:hypothetical protein
MSVFAVAVLGAVSLHAVDSTSLDGDRNLKYWQQKSAEEAVRDVAAVPTDAISWEQALMAKAASVGYS